MPDCEPTNVAVVAGIAIGGTSWWAGFERNCRKARNRTAVAVVALAAAVAVAAAGLHRPHLGDYPEGLDGTATYSGISGPNAAPSPITYHPCATTARRNVLLAYRFIYEVANDSPCSSHLG